MLCSASPCPLLIVWVFTEQNDSNKKNHSYRWEKTGKQAPHLKQEVTNSSLRRSRQRASKARISARTACPKKWKLPRQPRNQEPFPHPRPEPIYRSLKVFSDTPAPEFSSVVSEMPSQGPHRGLVRFAPRRSRAGIRTVLPNLLDNSQCKREM